MASNEKIKISSLWERVNNNRKCLRHSNNRIHKIKKESKEREF